MKVYNKEKTQILPEYDLTKGYLMEDTITINQPEIPAVEEQFHYETIKEYENGGKDVFVHISKLEEKGLKKLFEGQQVSYELYDDRGRIAAGAIEII